MSSFLSLLNVVSSAWGTAVVRASLTGGIMLLLVGGLCLIWQRMPATGRAWLWRLAFCKLLLALLWSGSVRLPLLPAHPIPQSSIPASIGRTAREAAMNYATQEDDIGQASTELAPPSGQPPLSPSTQPSRVSPSEPVAKALLTTSKPQDAEQTTPQLTAITRVSPTMPTAASVLLLLWLGGVGIGLGRVIRARRTVRRMKQGCSAPGANYNPLLAEVCAQFKGVHVPQLLMGSHIVAPALTGIARPAILLPSDVVHRAPQEEFCLILAHEVAHQKRRDLAWNWLLCAAQIFFFFHPLVWWGGREWQRANEMACDSLALRATGASPAHYGSMLLRVALAPRHGAGLFSVGVNDRYVSLKQRLQALQHSTSPERRWLVALPLVLGLWALVPWGLRARTGHNTPLQTSPRNTPSPTQVVPVSSTTYNSEQGPTIEDMTQPAILGALPGRLVGQDRQPISGATVYVMPTFRNGKKPIAQVTTDAQGHFRFTKDEVQTGPSAHDIPVVQIIADAGERGFAYCDWFYDHPVHPITLQLPATTTLRTTFLDDKGHPVIGIGVHVGQLRRGPGYWLGLPSMIHNRFKGRTDEKGQLMLSGLPQGWLAQLVLDDEHVPDSPSGIEDRQGGRFAPIAQEEAIALDVAVKQSTIRLLPTATLQGHVNLGTGSKPLVQRRIELHRINSAELRGNREGSDTDILHTLTDDEGNYSFTGLRPGLYQCWVDVPRRSVQLWLSSDSRLQLKAGAINTHNIAMTKSAIIEGRVISAQNGQPVAGQTVEVSDGRKYAYAARSDKDGKFRLYAIGGRQRVSLSDRRDSPPKGFKLPAQSEFELAVPSGGTTSLTLHLLPKPVVHSRSSRPITGRVVDEAGRPVAGAQVSVEGLDSPDLQRGAAFDRPTLVLKTNVQGRFALNASQSSHAVQLWADAGNKGTVQSTFALSGDQVTLHLQSNVSVTFVGRVTDADGKPMSGVPVQLYRTYNNCGYPCGSGQTDKDGRYTFTGQRPNRSYMVHSRGAERFNSGTLMATQPGQHITANLQAERADSFIAGQLLDEEGLPASRYDIWAEGCNDAVETDGSGRFRVPHTKSGTIHMTASSANLTNDFRVQAGRSDLVLHLSRTQNHAENYTFDPTLRQRLSALLGKPAPEIVASAWVNTSPLSLRTLRGKVVVLNFFWVTNRQSDTMPELSAIASQFAARGVQVLGVAQPWNFSAQPFSTTKVQARLGNANVTYPVAVDVARAKQAGQPSSPKGATASNYEGASLVVLDTQGRIAYAGTSLSGAMSIIGSLIQ